MMKRHLLILLLTSLISFSQTKEELDLCMALQSNSFTSNDEAEDALQRILDVIGASKNFVLTPCDKISNAVATAYKGTRYILYDREFMRIVNTITNDWSNLFIFAHEVGHHINGHSIDLLLYATEEIDLPSLEKKRQQELEADEFAAFVLSKLGASLSQLNEVISLISDDSDDKYSTHPNKDKRLLSVNKGYERGKLNIEKVTIVKKETRTIYVDSSMIDYDKNKSFTKEKDWYFKILRDVFNGNLIEGVTQGKLAGNQLLYEIVPKLKLVINEKEDQENLYLEFASDSLFPNYRSNKKINYSLIIIESSGKKIFSREGVYFPNKIENKLNFPLKGEFEKALSIGSKFLIKFNGYYKGRSIEEIYKELLFEEYKMKSEELRTVRNFENQDEFLDFYKNTNYKFFFPNYDCEGLDYPSNYDCKIAKQDPLYDLYWNIKGNVDENGNWMGEVKLNKKASDIFEEESRQIDLTDAYFQYSLNGIKKYL